MHPTIDTVGVLLEDKKGKLCQEIREALRQKKIVLLRKKKKGFDRVTGQY